jgi:uncharacterized membrane protein YeaQ/YmgE (transglycosylase-associated protein family)
MVQNTMHIIWTIIIGAIVGFIAKFLMPGRDPGGFIITTLLGIGGALLAGFIGHQAGWYEYNQGPGIIAAVIGAVAILAIYRLATGRRVAG